MSGNYNEQAKTLVNRQTVYEDVSNKHVGQDSDRQRTIKLVPFHNINSPSRTIKAIIRKLSKDGCVRLGRLERHNEENKPIVLSEKVVSRNHAEFWLKDGQWFVKDVGSSSGTYINSVRLSEYTKESQLRQLATGDIIRFGSDYRGGTTAQYKAVSVRVELDGVGAPPPTAFQVSQVERLKDFINADNIENCAICLAPMKPTFALFLSPCAHLYHYKCIRTCMKTYPLFECPICRKMCDIEMDDDDSVDGLDIDE